MQVIYPIVCGVDVHKTFIVAVICDSTSIEPKYIRKRFSTFKNSLIDFRDWLLQHDCQNVCMESTGKYYIPVYNALEGHISNVVVANPKWVRAVKGEKDDNKDAKWIADLFKLGMARSSFIPGKDIRILRELTRYLYKVVGMAAMGMDTLPHCPTFVMEAQVCGVTTKESYPHVLVMTVITPIVLALIAAAMAIVGLI